MADNRFVMVSEWMVKGNINEFLGANVDTDRLELVRLPSRSLIFTFGSLMITQLL